MRELPGINYNTSQLRIPLVLPQGLAMETTTIEIPSELLTAAKITQDEVKVELAKHFYKLGRITEKQARQLAGEDASLEEMFLRKNQISKIDMDEFISWAAHDLKSPLNAIIGFTKVVIKGIDGPVNELQVTDLSSAHTNGQRMLTLTNNLIDMARLNNGDIKIEISDGDIAQTFLDASNRWKTQNPGKELQTEIIISQPAFRFDTARMRQITGGLLTYAANHVAEGGKVTLLVRENEEGISAEIKSSGEKARDKFEMDLAMLGFICRGLIRLHGGDLSLGEDTGTGLTLKFTLPKA